MQSTHERILYPYDHCSSEAIGLEKNTSKVMMKQFIKLFAIHVINANINVQERKG